MCMVCVCVCVCVRLCGGYVSSSWLAVNYLKRCLNVLGGLVFSIIAALLMKNGL